VQIRSGPISVKMHSFSGRRKPAGPDPLILTDAQSNTGRQPPYGKAQRRFTSLLICISAGVSAIGFPSSSGSLEPTTPLAEYARQSWGMENGLPQNSVHALLQTRDGFLWLGTEGGLVRFDGAGFMVLDHSSTPALPSGDIRYLVEGKEDALWVGTSEGLARLKDNTVTTFGARDALPPDAIAALKQTEQGNLRLERMQEAPGYGRVSLFQGGPSGGFPKDEIIFKANLEGGETATGTRNAVVVAHGVRQAVFEVGKELPGSRVQALLADREDCLWIGTDGGLVRVLNGQVQKLPVTDPLASASILSLLEDREENLWVGTEASGLQVLRDTRFRIVDIHNGLSSDRTTTVVEDRAGALWVGTAGSGLNAMHRSGNSVSNTKTYTVRDGLLSDIVLSLAAAPNGDLWVGTADGLNRIHEGRVDSYTSADGLPDDFVRSLLVDVDDSLWVGTRRGLTHWMHAPEGTRMDTYTQANGLGSDLVGAMARDAHGNLWVATLAGLSRLQGGKITNYTTANGLSSDVVTALLSRSDGTLLIGSQDRGWSLSDGTKFSIVKDDALRATTVHAILDDGLNHLWFATGNGIARCDCTITADCVRWMEFGPGDGLRSRETAMNSHPSAWRSRDGHLWFATPKGLVEVDPAHFPVNSLPPPVVVERFAVDDIDQPLRGADSRARVLAGHNHFQFTYAGLSFVSPQKVRYKYMLDGFDHAWTDAGARRVAYYTNIPPGTYTFRVQAANNDGLWNMQGAALEFELEPHFYQTVWFYILLSLATAGLVALLLRRRLLVAEREFNAVLGERSRIAREIHDTLAQGYVGISVQLEVLAELLRHRKVEEAANQLDTTRGHVREGLAEARQSIWALRSQDSGEKTLPVNLRRVTEQARSHNLDANFSVHGAYRPLPPGKEREIVRVTQEAIHNVMKHAAAKTLFVQLDYGPAEVALEVRDDGRGFAADHVSELSGHFGLTGMRERAAAIGGTLDVISKPGDGTTVRLHAPAPREAE
jgi:signal transduction histidine kinase/ligand-binding sensor domain-containing protein